MNFSTTIDLATVVLLPVTAFFLARVVTHQDTLERRLNSLAQRLTAIDGEVERV